MVKKYCYQWVEAWCCENGWTDLFIEQRHYWAFPPGAVMPVPIPNSVLRSIKAEKGLTPYERWWIGCAWTGAIAGTALTIMLQSPMPLVAAFALGAFVTAMLDDN
ncbi:MAG: hypothetical protein NZ772_07445 [Cyanobacteria bacterium]|nr:hypothetical protein [Cyanobacteriota bacterium]MDW8201014.1 hypothetical protein [Cyanobacteriota bacterium SKYGB_h_bin112]